MSFCIFSPVFSQSDSEKAQKSYQQAEHYQKKQLYDSAIFFFKEASVLYNSANDYKSYWNSLNQLAYNYAQNKQSEKAREILKTVIEKNMRYSGGQNSQVADAYYMMAISFFTEKEYDKEIDYLNKCLVIREKIHRPISLQVAETKNTMGIAFSRKHDYQASLTVFLEALHIRQKLNNSDKMSIITSLGNVAASYRSLGKYDEALNYYQKELHLAKSYTKNEHSLWGKSYNQIANIYFTKGNVDVAKDYFTKAYQLHRRLLDKNDLQIASDLNNLGACEHALGKYEEAVKIFEQALKIRLGKLDKQHADVAQIYNNLGASFEALKNYEKSLEYHLKALLMRQEAFGENSANTAISYNNLGNLYNSKGEYNLATQYYEKALSSWKNSIGESHIEVAKVYNNLGVTYSEKGEYNKAIDYYYRSLSVRKNLYGQNHPEVATSLNNLGVTHYYMGEFEKALEFYEQAAQIRKTILGEKHPDYAVSINNIGATFYQQGKYDEALDYYIQAMEIRVKLYGDNHVDLAQAYNNIGATYLDKGEFEQALEFYKKALDLRQKQLGKKHPYVAGIYNNLGIAYYRLGNYQTSIQNFHNSLTANLIDFSDSSFYNLPKDTQYSDQSRLFNAFIGKAECFLKLYDKTNKELLGIAVQHIEAADTLLDNVRSEFTTEADKIQLANNVNRLTETAMKLYQELFVLEKDKKYLERAFYFSEKSKANILYASIAARSFQNIPDSLQQVESFYKNQISLYEQRLLEEKALDNAANPEKMATLRKHIFEFRRDYEALIKKYEQDYKQYYDLKYNSQISSVSQLQAFLKTQSKSVLVEYFLSSQGIYISVISAKKFDILFIKNNPELESKIRGLRNAIIYQIDKSFLGFSLDLYEYLMLPVDEYFKKEKIKVKHITFITDGILSYLPFESLITKIPSSKEKLAYEKLPYLLQKYAISYAFSATLLLYQQNNHRHTHENNYIAFAPIFEKGNKKSQATQDFYRSSSQFNTGAFSEDGNNINSLPATRQEVEGIVKLHTNKKLSATSHFLEEASEKKVKAGLRNYKYVHFATHGFVNENVPSRSGLLLSMPTEEGEDGILYAGEIYNLDINADLVTLSACETGLGKVVRGEGLIGLTRGFLYAGAKNVVVSLWKVSDDSSSDLMIQFYKNMLSKKTKSIALQKAKLKLLSSQKLPPYFWAAFILIGN